jgi:hypothetical protein
MNEPNVAALAEKLHDMLGCRVSCRGGRLANDKHPSHVEAYIPEAKRLLDSLPDWSLAPKNAKLRRNAIMVEQEALIASQDREIARLRSSVFVLSESMIRSHAIEEAARALRAISFSYHPSDPTPNKVWVAQDGWDALNAALSTKENR